MTPYRHDLNPPDLKDRHRLNLSITHSERTADRITLQLSDMAFITVKVDALPIANNTPELGESECAE
jgi:hypothetical protein